MTVLHLRLFSLTLIFSLLSLASVTAYHYIGIYGDKEGILVETFWLILNAWFCLAIALGSGVSLFIEKVNATTKA